MRAKLFWKYFFCWCYFWAVQQKKVFSKHDISGWGRRTKGRTSWTSPAESSTAICTQRRPTEKYTPKHCVNTPKHCVKLLVTSVARQNPIQDGPVSPHCLLHTVLQYINQHLDWSPSKINNLDFNYRNWLPFICLKKFLHKLTIGFANFNVDLL